MELTPVVDKNTQKNLVIVDKDGNLAKHIIAFNIETKEAEIYILDDYGMPTFDWLDDRRSFFDGQKQYRTEKVILKDHKIMFFKN